MAATRSPPAQPLVVILGSTGTGKSDLAVELATRFNGEIVNADAMQLYKGLPIITNKITVPERRGIPHHLLDHTDLDDSPWAVDDFKRAAKNVISEIRSRGNLPIVVGGTHYYIDQLLFENISVGVEKEEEPRSAYPILDEPTEVIFAKLKDVDPVMAAKWHPNDRRKIQRSLEIYLRYGRPASEIYAEQKQDNTAATVDTGDSPWESLMFWVHTEPAILQERLNGRVDKMLDAGLMDEIQQMHNFVKQNEDRNEPVKFTQGIWQSIGFKEFRPYLRAADDDGTSAPALEKLHAAALEDMKVSTRQYAKYQTKWIRSKTIPLLRRRAGAMEKLFVVDSSEPSQWMDNVAEPAAAVTRQFLQGEETPAPASLSLAAARVLDAVVAPRAVAKTAQNTCETCGVTTVTEESWLKHIQSKKHRKIQQSAKRRALVPVQDQSSGEVEKPRPEEPVRSRSTSPDIQLDIFEQRPGG